MAEMLADDICDDDRRRVVNAGIRTVGTPRSRTCGRLADVGVTGHHVDRHRDPRGAPRPQSCRTRVSDQRARGVRRRGALHRRDRRRRPDRGAASCSTSTTSTPPSRNSMPATSPAKRPPTRTRGQSSRGPSPHSTGSETPRTTPDWVNVDHRRATRFAPDDLTALHPCHVGPHTGLHDLHRGCASAERPRSGRHPSGARDLTRGLRRRVADNSTSDGRRRPDQPLRDLSTRPTSTPRSQDSTAQPSDAAVGKRGKPGVRAHADVLHRPRLGRHGQGNG